MICLSMLLVILWANLLLGFGYTRQLSRVIFLCKTRGACGVIVPPSYIVSLNAKVTDELSSFSKFKFECVVNKR